MLVALVIEANRQTSELPELEDLRSRYNIKVSDVLLPSSIDPWDALGLLIVSRTYEGTAACLLPGKYGPALSALLNLLGATTFEVDWKKEEILTDAELYQDFPSPQGWKLFKFNGPEQSGSVLSENVPSSSWTGLPSNFELSQERQQRLAALLSEAEYALDTAGVGNAEKAMARAYIVAAKTLADAPEPPADLIWELIARANNISGIASLLVSLVSLFTIAAH